MSESFRQLLRALPDFPQNLPDFDPATAPADPVALFKLWLDEALAAGALQPHACSLGTADRNGQPSARMLILKKEQGRQVRVAGPVVELSSEASAADWQARPAADGSHNPDWQLYAIRAAEIEFWQARHDRRHIRHRYGPDGTPAREQPPLG